MGIKLELQIRQLPCKEGTLLWLSREDLKKIIESKKYQALQIKCWIMQQKKLKTAT
jgi:hypothetical protein